MPAPRQLALALRHTESFAREDFLRGPPNATALALIDSWPDWPARAMVLTGPEGSGKSHLATIWATECGARFLSARALTPANLSATLVTGALVLEDVASGAFDEAALFHLLNLVREQEAWLLITARRPPSGWVVALPDLASRLRALSAVAVASPNDELLRAVMAKMFADRQLCADPALLDYLVSRIERSFAAARAAVDRLDREALQLKRPLTRALAADLFRSPGA
jgi:chromosomal replication initiation ATPase DnaA